MKASAFYDSVASNYNLTNNEAFYSQIADELLKLLPAKTYNNILEIGSGTGFTTMRIKNAYPNAKITAIEPAPAMMAKAQEKVYGITWKNMSFANLNLDFDQNYDLIICSMAAHWLTEKEWQKLNNLAKKSVIALALPAPHPNPLPKEERGNVANQLLKNLLFKLKAHPAWLKQARHQITGDLIHDFEIKEEFTSEEELTKTLHARGVFLALFGDKADEARRQFEIAVSAQPSAVSQFTWNFKLAISKPLQPIASVCHSLSSE